MNSEKTPYSIHAQGLQFSSVATKEQAEWAFKQIEVLSQGIRFAVGDWAIVCEERFGKDWTNEVLSQSSFTFDELKTSVTVARKLPWFKRSPKLSFDHHAIACRHDQPELALKWAQDGNLTPAQLAVAVRANQPLTKNQINDARSVNTWITPLCVVNKFLNWKKSAPVANWTAEDKTQLLNDLAPIIEFIEELKNDQKSSDK